MIRQPVIARCVITGLLAGFCLQANAQRPEAPFGITITPLGTYASQIFDQSAAEIVAHDPITQRLFVVMRKAASSMYST